MEEVAAFDGKDELIKKFVEVKRKEKREKTRR